MKAETKLLIKDKFEISRIYKCSGSNYWLESLLCEARQKIKNKSCSRCALRIGGKNDPRKKEKENGE